MRTAAISVVVVSALALAAVRAATQPDRADVEWRAYGGTNASLKYAPLDQITKDNVNRLRIAWRQSAMPMAIRGGRTRIPIPTNYQVTPLMAAGLLYATAGDGSVVALHPATGAVVWSFVPPGVNTPSPAEPNQPSGEVLAGRSANRGVLAERLGTGVLAVGINCAIQVGIRFPRRRLSRSLCPPLGVVSDRSPTRLRSRICAKIVGVPSSEQQRSGRLRRLLHTGIRGSAGKLQRQWSAYNLYTRASRSSRTTRS